LERLWGWDCAVEKDFYKRLRNYYIDVAKVLRGEADAASIFPNPTDIGMSREKIYAEFLRQHAPSKCNVLLGGFLFDEDGNESKQLDIIVTTDTAIRFNFHSSDGSGKSFSPVEGTLGVVSIKSTLNKNELIDALDGIASIPPTKTLDGRIHILLTIKNYDDWPLKVIYATNGIALETLSMHLNDYYTANPTIPFTRRPNFIHVAGQYVLFRAVSGMTMQHPNTGIVTELTKGEYYPITTDSDVQAIVWTLNELQQNATSSAHILFSYGEIINTVSGIS